MCSFGAEVEGPGGTKKTSSKRFASSVYSEWERVRIAAVSASSGCF